ncbi:MAG: leucine-rich repeat domain-containing protein [Bacteroidales bacterium]|nr:leucine-rich repeat domain-containing protein [Bacteroidales bacterium]
MKKYLLTLLSIIFSITLMGQTTFDVGQLTYTIIDVTNNYVSVKKQNDNINTHIVIPSNVTYNSTEYTVTQIADNGFCNLHDLKGVTIPNTITKIGKNAFQNTGNNNSTSFVVEMGNSVAEIGDYAFCNCQKINSVSLPETCTSIGSHAFDNCINLTSINLPQGMTEIKPYTFWKCEKLEKILIPEGVTTIGEQCFAMCNSLKEVIFPSSLDSIYSKAFENCHGIRFIFFNSNVYIAENTFGNCEHLTVVCMGDSQIQTSGSNPFGNNVTAIIVPCGQASNYPQWGYNNLNLTEKCIRRTKQNGNFYDPATWEGNKIPTNLDHHFHIKKGDTVTLTNSKHIYPYTSLNEGVLRIDVAAGGQLIERDIVSTNNNQLTMDQNYLHENLDGVVEVVVPATQGKWNFIGAPFEGYDLWGVKIGPGGKDVTVVQFDYDNNDWSNNFSTVDSVVEAGEGFLAWPFYDGGVVFSTQRDYGEPIEQIESGLINIPFALNSDNVVVSKTITVDDSAGNWLALANPYPAKLCVNSFITQNPSADIQGQGIYVHNTQSNTFTFKANGTNYDLGVGQGFFVNFNSAGEKQITFKKEQLHENLESNHTYLNKSSKKKFMTISMFEGNKESELLFAHNEKAQQGYDIFDANKLFAMDQITEPYFVTDGMSLVKEEVKTLPYYAQMNVRSFEDKEVTFRLKDIPEDLVVFLIDNGKATRMNGGVEYRTKITAGENANRFQLLVKKASTIEDAKDNNIEISNSNRFVSISSTQTDLQIEVYNALGQKIMTTNNYNFNLNEASAGAYIVKAYNKAVSKTHKIVIK